MNLLAVETTGVLCSLALMRDGTIVAEADIDEPRAHAGRLLPTLQALLAEQQLTLADLTGIAYGRGPGSFTGQRIGIAAVQGLVLGSGLRAWPISSLQAAAQQAVPVAGSAASIAVALDARMDEVYAGEFTVAQGRAVPAGSERLCAAAALQTPAEAIRVGDGWPAGVEASVLRPRAREILLLAQAAIEAGNQGVKSGNALPVYLRNRVADEPRQRR